MKICENALLIYYRKTIFYKTSAHKSDKITFGECSTTELLLEVKK